MKQSTLTVCKTCLNKVIFCEDCKGDGYVKEGSETHKRQKRIANAKAQRKRQEGLKRYRNAK
jgi:hypothetical protein